MSNTFNQSHVITDPDARWQWVMEGDHQDRCQVCHRPLAVPMWLGFDPHHIIRGANGRSDEPCNLLLLCAKHHEAVHGGQSRKPDGTLWPAITLEMVLFVKSQTKEWDAKRLEELYHRRLPELKPLHKDYLRLRTRWHLTKVSQ